MHEAAPHSAAHMLDGALMTGAVMQGCTARGDCIVSLDARRAYDAEAHNAVLEALRDTEIPLAAQRFVAGMLGQRDYAMGGQRIRPPVGRGIPQGAVLGPVLFALVAERG